MSINTNIPSRTFSHLEKVVQELTQLHKENVDILMEIESTKKRVEQSMMLAQIEAKVYYGIRKYFK